MSQVKRSRKVAPPAAQQEDLFYGALVGAWLNTKLERDKSVLMLSAGAVGLLATLMTTVGPYTYIAIALYAVGTIAFAGALVIVLIVFDRNAKHLEQAARDPKAHDPVLAKMDTASFWLFVVGAVVLGALGFMTAVEKIHTRTEASMANSDQTKSAIPASGDTLQRSFNGISEMRPAQTQQPTTPPPAALLPAAAQPAVPQAGQSGGDTGKD